MKFNSLISLASLASFALVVSAPLSAQIVVPNLTVTDYGTPQGIPAGIDPSGQVPPTTGLAALNAFFVVNPATPTQLDLRCVLRGVPQFMPEGPAILNSLVVFGVVPGPVQGPSVPVGIVPAPFWLTPGPVTYILADASTGGNPTGPQPVPGAPLYLGPNGEFPPSFSYGFQGTAPYANGGRTTLAGPPPVTGCFRVQGFVWKPGNEIYSSNAIEFCFSQTPGTGNPGTPGGDQ